MSLFSSKTSRTQQEVRGRRKRSESVSGIKDVAKERRNPFVNYSEDNDVVTMICAELGRGILMSPKVDTGILFKTSADSRRDINKSDTTVLITCAILDHIGNKEMSSRLLNKSSTISRYYDKLNLNNNEVRTMFVTMIFALSPDFVAMVEKTLILTIERSSSQATAKRDDDPMTTALAKLTISKEMTPRELRRAGSFDDEKQLSLSPEAKRFSLQATPTEYYAPSLRDAINKSERNRRHRIVEGDLINYNVRRRSGTEMDFSEVFPSAIPPVAIEVAESSRRPKDKRGLGFQSRHKEENEHIQAMNRILGSHNVKSVDLNTGEIRVRKPNVTDFLDSESVSGSIFDKVPDVESVYNSTPDTKDVKRPLPTEYYLPSVAAESKVTVKSKLARVDSFEELMKREGGFY
jgi:hypothetical protein